VAEWGGWVGARDGPGGAKLGRERPNGGPRRPCALSPRHHTQMRTGSSPTRETSATLFSGGMPPSCEGGKGRWRGGGRWWAGGDGADGRGAGCVQHEGVGCGCVGVWVDGWTGGWWWWWRRKRVVGAAVHLVLEVHHEVERRVGHLEQVVLGRANQALRYSVRHARLVPPCHIGAVRAVGATGVGKHHYRGLSWPHTCPPSAQVPSAQGPDHGRMLSGNVVGTCVCDGT